eukprot:1145005-Pelagomonas_calceolata.AAC.1
MSLKPLDRLSHLGCMQRLRALVLDDGHCTRATCGCHVPRVCIHRLICCVVLFHGQDLSGGILRLPCASCVHGFSWHSLTGTTVLQAQGHAVAAMDPSGEMLGLELSTPAVSGLSENDFILAAKWQSHTCFSSTCVTCWIAVMSDLSSMRLDIRRPSNCSAVTPPKKKNEFVDTEELSKPAGTGKGKDHAFVGLSVSVVCMDASSTGTLRCCMAAATQSKELNCMLSPIL